MAVVTAPCKAAPEPCQAVPGVWCGGCGRQGVKKLGGSDDSRTYEPSEAYNRGWHDALSAIADGAMVVPTEGPPQDRGCRWCQAEPSEWCEADCAGPTRRVHPDNAEWSDE